MTWKQCRYCKSFEIQTLIICWLCMLHDNGMFLFFMLQSAKVYEAAELERMKREGYGGYGSFHSTWPLNT